MSEHGPADGDVSFRASSIEGLIGQLVGACSSMRFWDEMPSNYPYGAGAFRDDVARRLVDAAMQEYRRLTAPEPASLAAARSDRSADEPRRGALVEIIEPNGDGRIVMPSVVLVNGVDVGIIAEGGVKVGIPDRRDEMAWVMLTLLPREVHIRSGE